jgi:hypothetical protein
VDEVLTFLGAFDTFLITLASFVILLRIVEWFTSAMANAGGAPGAHLD